MNRRHFLRAAGVTLSLPVLAAASALTYWLFFPASLDPLVFAAVVAAEALLWRPVEAAIIVNNGLGRFGSGAILTILGTVFRSAFAAAFIGNPSFRPRLPGVRNPRCGNSRIS